MWLCVLKKEVDASLLLMTDLPRSICVYKTGTYVKSKIRERILEYFIFQNKSMKILEFTAGIFK